MRRAVRYPSSQVVGNIPPIPDVITSLREKSDESSTHSRVLHTVDRVHSQTLQEVVDALKRLRHVSCKIWHETGAFNGRDCPMRSGNIGCCHMLSDDINAIRDGLWIVGVLDLLPAQNQGSPVTGVEAQTIVVDQCVEDLTKLDIAAIKLYQGFFGANQTFPEVDALAASDKVDQKDAMTVLNNVQTAIASRMLGVRDLLVDCLEQIIDRSEKAKNN